MPSLLPHSVQSMPTADRDRTLNKRMAVKQPNRAQTTAAFDIKPEKWNGVYRFEIHNKHARCKIQPNREQHTRMAAFE